MKLDKYTFGKTPAAIYLAHRLNEINNKKFTRKISSRIAEIRKMIRDMGNAYIADQIDTHTLISFVSFLRLRVSEMADDLLFARKEEDVVLYTLCVNLMANILIGDIKNIIRKTQKICMLEQQYTKLVKYRKSINIRSMKSVKDDITPETLIKKSKQSLARRGLKDSLY